MEHIGAPQLNKRVLLVDADLGSATSVWVLHERVDEPHNRNSEVVKVASVSPDSRRKCRAPCVKDGDQLFWYLK